MDVRNLEGDTLKNRAYRKILFTNKHMQLVLMSLKVGQDIPSEVHRSTQFIRIEKGRALATIGKKKYLLEDGSSLIIPLGTRHYIKNIGSTTLKLYTIYSPPAH